MSLAWILDFKWIIMIKMENGKWTWPRNENIELLRFHVSTTIEAYKLFGRWNWNLCCSIRHSDLASGMGCYRLRNHLMSALNNLCQYKRFLFVNESTWDLRPSSVWYNHVTNFDFSDEQINLSKWKLNSC